MLLTKGQIIDFPDSVIELFQGYIGQPHGWFSERITEGCLKRQRTDYCPSRRATRRQLIFDALKS